MIKIDYRNLLTKPDLEKNEKKLNEIKNMPAPAFAATKPDLQRIASAIKKFKKFKNVILIANGGSRTSAFALYNSLADFRNKVRFKFVTSPEPEVIRRLKKNFFPKDTLVLAISKSGDNINSLEPLIALINYPVLVITGEKENTLRKIARQKKWDIVLHPEVGGRYSGMTTCGLVPATLMGLNIREIYAGAEDAYKKYGQKNGAERNDALKLAAYFNSLEGQKYTEIFSCVYSTSLFAFLPLMIQLIHESTGKNGKGQTIFGDSSPESQHHTNQRFFGGRKNVAALIMSVEKSAKDFQIKIPKDIQDIHFNGNPLKKLNNISAHDTLHFDMQGVLGNCIAKKIPAAVFSVDEVNPRSMGELMVFWQYFAMYSALLRGQNPFDQPEVEDSKKISLRLRMERK